MNIIGRDAPICKCEGHWMHWRRSFKNVKSQMAEIGHKSQGLLPYVSSDMYQLKICDHVGRIWIDMLIVWVYNAMHFLSGGTWTMWQKSRDRKNGISDVEQGLRSQTGHSGRVVHRISFVQMLGNRSWPAPCTTWHAWLVMSQTGGADILQYT